MKNRIPFLLAVALIGSVAIASVEAQSLYTWGHADIGLAYHDGRLHAHWHLADGAIVNGQPLPDSQGEGHEFEADELIALVANTRNAAAGSDDYLGVASGTPVYVAGLVNFQPYVGFGAEELNPLDWTGDITVSLLSWSIPTDGNFALYTTNRDGTVTADITLSTFNPSSADSWGLGENVFGIGVGGHDHYQFGFTKPGWYSIELQFSGYHRTDAFQSVTETFTFQIVPEPSSSLLILLGASGLALLRRRRARA